VAHLAELCRGGEHTVTEIQEPFTVGRSTVHRGAGPRPAAGGNLAVSVALGLGAVFGVGVGRLL
jgi:hypothetical protein